MSAVAGNGLRRPEGYVQVSESTFHELIELSNRLESQNTPAVAGVGIPKRYLTPAEAAEYTGIPYDSLREWYYIGVGPRTVDLPPMPNQENLPELENWRYDIRDLDAFVDLLKFRTTEMPDLDIIRVNMEFKEAEEADASRKAEESKLVREPGPSDLAELRGILAALCGLPVLLGRLAVSTLPAMLDQVTRIVKGVLS